MSEALTTEGKKLRVGQRLQLEVAEAVTLNGQTIIPVTGDATDEMRRVLRSYAVFNADQDRPSPEQFRPSRSASCRQPTRCQERAQRFVDSLPATVHIGGDRTFYDRSAAARR